VYLPGLYILHRLEKIDLILGLLPLLIDLILKTYIKITKNAKKHLKNSKNPEKLQKNQSIQILYHIVKLCGLGAVG